ncbi:hypothetical protein BC939DRAFT_115871 [Gamsiella multidivaricata]|uniref:uncharacterized protein n=1 Tax=Gamsiella multidivaricata TaxID=101098 RepID=UPI00221F7BE0|nr:uncharacterized protein BC939DRAFT_115871 [Gamsiella multidivaricata]KAI7826166.1 hypothetical protein BC939DRAFT_115871 [Gamsiella multidivaricata]
MAHPVRGSSRTNESNAPHPQLVLTPLPPRENYQPNVVSYDPYETDYSESPHPLNPHAGGVPPQGWDHQSPHLNRSNTLSPTTASGDDIRSDSAYATPSAPQLDLDLGALSLDDNPNNTQQDDSSSAADLNSLSSTYRVLRRRNRTEPARRRPSFSFKDRQR